MAVSPKNTVSLTEPLRPRATVEIETWAKGGVPKVTVRVDDDDPNRARELAIQTYLETVTSLTEAGACAAPEED